MKLILGLLISIGILSCINTSMAEDTCFPSKGKRCPSGYTCAVLDEKWGEECPEEGCLCEIAEKSSEDQSFEINR